MVQPTKKQKVEGSIIYKEEVLFNSDTLSKVISYLPSVDVLNLALTCKRFGISNDYDNSNIVESACIAVHDIATEEQLAALPHYDGESSLADYHYLQLMRLPLTFDQLVRAEYVDNGDKSCVMAMQFDCSSWKTAFSNNIIRAGKHYVTFEVNNYSGHSGQPFVLVGVMRPGQANQTASETPLMPEFFQHYSPRLGRGGHTINNIHCCMYNTFGGKCHSSYWDSSYWEDGTPSYIASKWEGSESMSSSGEIGMLLDLDDGVLIVYKNGQKLGVMKKGLAGPYCWVVSIGDRDSQVTIKRGTIPS